MLAPSALEKQGSSEDYSFHHISIQQTAFDKILVSTYSFVPEKNATMFSFCSVPCTFLPSCFVCGTHNFTCTAFLSYPRNVSFTVYILTVWYFPVSEYGPCVSSKSDQPTFSCIHTQTNTALIYAKAHLLFWQVATSIWSETNPSCACLFQVQVRFLLRTRDEKHQTYPPFEILMPWHLCIVLLLCRYTSCHSCCFQATRYSATVHVNAQFFQICMPRGIVWETPCMHIFHEIRNMTRKALYLRFPEFKTLLFCIQNSSSSPRLLY